MHHWWLSQDLQHGVQESLTALFGDTKHWCSSYLFHGEDRTQESMRFSQCCCSVC